MVEVSVRQQHLDWRHFEGLTQGLKFAPFRCGGHARIHNSCLAIPVIDEVGLFTKDIACEGMHHGA